MEQKSNRNKIIAGVAGLISFAISYYVVQQLFFKKPTFDKAMMEAASELNKTCPLMVDSETRLDNAVALPDNIFQYNYTLINFIKTDVDTIQAHQSLDQRIINNVKTNPELKMYRDNNVTMAYYYKDKNGDYLMRINVTPEKYK